MKIRYPSILDMKAELDKLTAVIKSLEGVSIIEVTQSLIIISDGDEEYEYDSISETMEEWENVLLRSDSE